MSHADPPDWTTIVQRHAAQVFRIAFRILGSVHDAEDASQIVFTEALRLRTEQSVHNWAGLFARLATVRAIDLLRRRHKTVPLSDDDRVSNIEPHAHASAAELAGWLRHSVSKLPEQQAAIFSLTYFESLGRTEIAELLGISVEAVSTALYKARQRLLEQYNILDGVSNK
jgi:RNA polymerase sigma-70 factor (ECF subfamily)